MWIFLSPLLDTAAPGASVLISTLNAAALALWPFTIVRTHWEILVTSDQSVATESQIAGVGQAVVSDQAAAIGITAIPTPVTDLGSDLFFVHQSMLSNFLFKDATGFEADDGVHYSVDSKAMRRVNDSEDVVATFEVGGGSGGGATIITMGRMLLKLH